MGNDANVSKRDGFRSRGGFIIACIGSAVAPESLSAASSTIHRLSVMPRESPAIKSGIHCSYIRSGPMSGREKCM